MSTVTEQPARILIATLEYDGPCFKLLLTFDLGTMHHTWDFSLDRRTLNGPQVGTSDSRQGSAYGMHFIMELLYRLELKNFDSLVGTACRVRIRKEADDTLELVGIGNLLRNAWVEPERLDRAFQQLEGAL